MSLIDEEFKKVYQRLDELSKRVDEVLLMMQPTYFDIETKKIRPMSDLNEQGVKHEKNK